MVKFAERLKELREEENLSQRDLAKALNVSQPTIAKWETGDRRPDFEMLEVIKNYFKVSTDYILFD